MEEIIKTYLDSRDLETLDKSVCEICGAQISNIVIIDSERPLSAHNLIALCSFHEFEARAKKISIGILEDTVKFNLLFLRDAKGEFVSNQF